MPLNNQLIERGATLLRTTTTSAQYRLFALLGTTPPKPGLKRVQVGGVALEVEVWQVPTASVGSFLSLIPAPLGLGKLELMDGSWVTGFVCEEHALAHAQDISSFAGWRSYVKNSTSHNSSTQPEKNHV
jgi:allophanate hydrolase